MEQETKKCASCGRELPLSEFGTHGRYGAYKICNECRAKSIAKGARAHQERRQMKKASLSQASRFDGMTPREVQEVLAAAARWLNSYGGFTCEVSLRYEKEISLQIR